MAANSTLYAIGSRVGFFKVVENEEFSVIHFRTCLPVGKVVVRTIRSVCKHLSPFSALSYTRPSIPAIPHLGYFFSKPNAEPAPGCSMDAVWMQHSKGVRSAGGKQGCWLGKCKVRRGSWCFMIVQGVADPDRFSIPTRQPPFFPPPFYLLPSIFSLLVIHLLFFNHPHQFPPLTTFSSSSMLPKPLALCPSIFIVVLFNVENV